MLSISTRCQFLYSTDDAGVNSSAELSAYPAHPCYRCKSQGKVLNLWETAQTQSSDEQASAKLWFQLWNKHFFPETEWVISQRPSAPPPLAGSGRRRVDITIEYLGGGGADNKPAVLAFHEAKRALDLTPLDVEVAESESWAFDACMSYLREHPELRFVYAFTSFGTEGRAWKCHRDALCLKPLFGSDAFAGLGEYVELHSSQARLIRRAVQTMRAVPPSG